MSLVADFTCRCEAAFMLDSSDSGYEEAAWLLIIRFAEAHATCGFVAPSARQAHPDKLVLGPMDLAPVDETVQGTTETLEE